MDWKPVAIFRHYPTEGPGYFATFLERHRIPWTLVRLDAGEAVPADPGVFSGLAFMGGPMSVNDDLPWIPAVLDLIRRAVAGNVPVVGHCLGAQLMSKALGGVVTRNPVKEIGWGKIRVTNALAARDWLGDVCVFDGFHWHGETFSIPSGTVRILESAYCPNQAFVLGPHLGMQCHVEMTGDLVRSWCESGAREIAASPGPAVQTVEAIQEDLEHRITGLNLVADRLYGRWIRVLA
ncbi:MAG TPA: type 1 glutamine amidotransferase [Burkholderiales bacterium]